MKNSSNKTIISIGEAAELFGVHIDTVRNWEKRGLLKPIKTPGGHRRYDKSQIQEIISKEGIMDEVVETTEKAVEIVLDDWNTLAGNEEWKQPKVRPAAENLKYEEERMKCYKRWLKTRLLKVVKDENFQPELAVLLENQRLINEASVDSGDVAQFKRISIPLVCRIWGSSVLRHLVSIQPMLGPTGLIYHFKNNKIVEDTVVAQTVKMKAVWTYEAQQDLRSAHNMDAEAELTAVLAHELTMEMDKQALVNITNGAGLKKEVDFSYLSGEMTDKWAAVQELLIDLARENQDLYHRPFPNWIVVGPDVGEVVCPKDNDIQDSWWGWGLGIKKWGNLDCEFGELTVWVDPLVPVGKVLIGYKGEHDSDSGYIHCPYIQLMQTPVVLDPHSFVPRKGIMSRFACKLVDPTYFSTLTVKNFISPKQYEEMQKVQQLSN